MDIEQYKKELADSGVDVVEDEAPANAQEDKVTEEETHKETKSEEKTEVEDDSNDSKIEDKSDTKSQSEANETKKRSIYDEYKEKKAEVKSEKELRIKAEQERDELAQKLANFNSASTREEIAEAKDELDAFALEKGLDPQAIKQMKQLFLKDVKTTIDPDIQAKLDRVLEFAKNNSEAIEKQQFNKEFESDGMPTVKEFFPQISADELGKVKEEINRLAHTKGYEDKPLDYIVYKNRSTLSSLVSPKKRGIEGKSRVDSQELSDDFNTEPDFSKMTYKEMLSWQEKYEKNINNSGLSTDSQGRKILI